MTVSVAVEVTEATVSVTAQEVSPAEVSVNVDVLPAVTETVVVEGGTAPTYTIITPEAEAALAEIEASVDAAEAAQAAAEAARDATLAVEFDVAWTIYASRWDTAPTLAGTIPAGSVYAYTLDGVTRYRLVPSPYDASADAFYAAFDGAALSDLIALRGT